MANPEHLEILRQGVEQWNRWRREYPNLLPDLSQAKLKGLNLSGANLRRATLNQADLHGANLIGAQLRRANLRGANLCEANLRLANLSRADLRRARVCSANLAVVNLRGASLDGANLSKAWATETHFDAIDLSAVKGLETIEHHGPSTIGIDTIYKSRGKIPEVFLRGCGVPDEFIAYIGSMVGRPIEFYSCFISYSTKDQEFADRLYVDLQAKGVRCWFAPHDIQGGKTIHEQIDEAIRRYDRLLLILSEHSIHSGWVETEIANAWERQIQQGKHVLFPVRLVSFEELEKWKCPDPKTGKDRGREIRKYFIPDFSNWKDHDPYQEAFQRLVSDLKAVDSQRQ